MYKSSVCSVLAISLLTPLVCPSQAIRQDLALQVAAVRQSVARNQMALRQYRWSEQTELSVKGDVRSSTASLCRYNLDGKIVKTPLGTPAAPKDLKGLKKRKSEDLKDYTERAATLIQHYVPPEPALIDAGFQGGRASMGQAGEGKAVIQFKDYFKPGDTLTFVFDTATNALHTVSVTTYVQDPKDDPVTMVVNFARLPDGTNHVADTTLTVPAKKVVIKATNSNYTKIAE